MTQDELNAAMTNEELNEAIKRKLDEKFIEDLAAILLKPEGRRFFSWILERCDINNCAVKGNSQDWLMAGRRSIGLDLIMACNSMGLSGVDLRQAAEREYIVYQIKLSEEIKKQAERKC